MLTIKMATIFLGSLAMTADLDTAIRFAMRTGTSCSSPDQTHVVDGEPVSPLAVITQGAVEAEKSAAAWLDGLSFEAAMRAFNESMPDTVRDPRAA